MPVNKYHHQKLADDDKLEFKGRFGTYVCTWRKAQQWLEFMRTPEGKKYLETCDVNERQFIRALKGEIP